LGCRRRSDPHLARHASALTPYLDPRLAVAPVPPTPGPAGTKSMGGSSNPRIVDAKHGLTLSRATRPSRLHPLPPSDLIR
jgi:hypothetical protein